MPTPATSNRLNLFGLPCLLDSNGHALSVRGRKSIALLGYLVLTYPQVHSRERLAGLFWPELTDKDARNNLRVAFARIIKSLGSPDVPVLVTDRLTATFNTEASLRCDASDFQAMLHSASEHCHNTQLTCEQCHSTLTGAITIYSADFMEGFHLEDCEEFGEWQRGMREQLRVSAIATLSALGQHAEHSADLGSAEQLTRQLLVLDPYREEAHRRLVTVLARCGERNAAIEHYSAMKARLHEELGVAPDETTHAVILAIENGELSPDADTRTIAINNSAAIESLHNLPIEKSEYIGNRCVIEQLTQYIKQRRLVTLTGIGGVGKTRLAVQAGRNLLSEFPGGVWFLRLAPLNTRTEMLSSLASILQIELLPGDEPITSIANQLGARGRLLIMDNFEHLLDARDIVSSLLELVHSLTILVTTRQQLQLTEEAVFPLSGLAYGSSGQLQSDTDELDDAAELFINSAQRTRLNFKVSASNKAAIGQIGYLVKGHPLALVIAASWVDVLACREIVEELERGLGILETEFSDVPERQRSVRATFNYSWTLLVDEEQRMFAALSSFRGGFDRSAAKQVAGASLIQLTRLVRKSLLQYFPDQDRYDMHELMRQFAEEKLHSSGCSGMVNEAHNKHYLALLGEVSINQFDNHVKQRQRLFNADFDNIRKAWYFALANEQQHQQLTAAISGLRLMCSLGAHSHMLLDLLQPALPLMANPDKDHLQRDLVLNLLLALGFAYRYTKGYFAPELDDIFARAYELTDDLETSAELFVVLYGRWSFNFTRGYLLENLTIISQWRDRLSPFKTDSSAPPYIVDAQFVVSMLEGPQLQYMGELIRGREVLQSGLALEDSTRYSSMMGNYGLNFAVSGRHWLAINQCIAGLLDHSEKTIARADAIAELENNPYLRMFVAFGQLIIYTVRKDVKQIFHYAEAVNRLVIEHRIFNAFQHHAEIYTAYAENSEDASSGIEQMQLLIDCGKGIPVFRVFDAQLLAESLVRAGNPTLAIDTIDTCISIAERQNIRISSAESPRIKGYALAVLGDTTAARQCYKESIEIAGHQGAGLYELRTALSFGKFLVSVNEFEEAKTLLSPAIDKHTECLNTTDFREAQTLLASLQSRSESKTDDGVGKAEMPVHSRHHTGLNGKS